MISENYKCFFIMPFLSELNYFYLYLKKYIENEHNIECSRGDSKVLTIPILEKIRNYVKSSDIIIADCSGRNPNVFYELGIAHTYDKKVILITSDDISEAPSDIRHYEFIKYELGNHEEFLEKLNNALRNVFIEDYDELYSKAKVIYNNFITKTDIRCEMATQELFIKRILNATKTQNIPQIDDSIEFETFILPKIISDSTDIKIMSKITEKFIIK